jgi:hypothetical protein
MVGTCCAPLLASRSPVDQAADLARMLKALDDPTRLRPVSLVAARGDGEACVCDFAAPCAAPTNFTRKAGCTRDWLQEEAVSC